jgi:hypothetical protein
VVRPPIEVADVVRAHAGAFVEACGGVVSSAKRRVLHAIASCRTARLGGHVERCDQCSHEAISYNSCRNRHCPKCQAAARAEWLEAREADLLPVPYFHVVFTVPPEIAELALQNKRVMYGILLRASAQTLLQIAADPKHLGAMIGLLSVLHTWGQTLMHHPHVHCVVPGGGLSLDGERWISCRPGFFLSVKVLRKIFRGKFLAMTKRAFADGKLSFQGKLASLRDPRAFAKHLEPCYSRKWVVYSKKPFGGPLQVLKYLARYTHRVAISNHRLLSLDNGRVRFRWKDYAHGNKKRVMTLDAVEFLRRFLLHVLPRGFMRIRHYGLLANTNRAELLSRARNALGVSADREPPAPSEVAAPADDDKARCPVCTTGRMVLVERLPRIPRGAVALVGSAVFDTS